VNGIPHNHNGHIIERRYFIAGSLASVFFGIGVPSLAKEMNWKMQKSAENIDVLVEMETDYSMLQVTYLVKNRSNGPLFLFNILHNRPGPNGVYEIDEGCYVELGDKEAVISKKQLSLPFGVLLENKMVPFVTRVLSRGNFRQTFQVPIPLFRAVYYEEPKKRQADEQATIDTMPVMFELGYFFGKPGTDELARTFHTNKGDVIGFDPFPITSQKIISVGPFPEVPVLL